jgi:iron complex transport system permease protein
MVRRGLGWGALGGGLMLCSVVISLSLGSAQLPLLQVWRILVHQLPLAGTGVHPDWPPGWEQIVVQVRFPRVVLALLVGACLSIAGAGYQGVLRNPLADPYTLGVASGAAVGAAFLILFGWHYVLLGRWMIPLAAFATGLVSLAMVFRLANIQGKFQMETLILSGVVVQAFLGAFVSFMVSLSDNVVNEIVFWMMGSLSMRGWEFSGMLLPYLAAGVVILLRYSTALNLFALGERQASHMGVDVERTKRIVLIASTLVAAAAVSITGIIGFVGLVIPHMIRLLTGPDYRLILPLSALFGGIYVLWADTLARMLLSPTEIPLGVVTAFIGAPFFAYLLHRNKRRIGG